MATKRNIRVQGAGLSGWGRSLSPPWFDGVAPAAAYAFGRKATQEHGAEILGRRHLNLLFRGSGRPDDLGYVAGNAASAVVPLSGVELKARTGGFTLITVNTAALNVSHNAISNLRNAGGSGMTLQQGDSNTTALFVQTNANGLGGASTGALPERGQAIMNVGIVAGTVAKAGLFKPGGDGPFVFNQNLPGAFDGGSAFLVIGSSPNAGDFGSAVSARHYFDLFYDFALTNAQLLDVYRWCAAELAKDGVAF